MNLTRFLLAAIIAAVSTAATMAQDPAALDQRTEKQSDTPTVSEADKEKAEALFQQGRKLFFQGDYTSAAEQLASAAEVNPTKTGYQLLLAKAYRFAGQDEQALGVLENILQSNPEHVEAGIDLAELITPTDQPDRVIDVLEPLLKFNHDYPIYHLLAEAHYEKESFDKARQYYEEATRLNPRNAGDHYQLANIYLAQKHFAKAAHAYEEAGRLGLTSGVYHFKLASVYFNLHNYLGQVATATVIGGQVGQIKNDMYLVDLVPGKSDEFYVAGSRSAIFQTVKAQQMGIDIFDIRFLEANIWLSARRYENAEKIYEALTDEVSQEDTALFWYYRAQTALGLKRFDDYLSRLNKAIEADPNVYQSTLADAYVTVANGYHQLGDNDRYLEYLDKAVQTSPLSASLHLTLGDAHWLASNADKAIQQYRLVLELEPEHAERVRLLNRIRGQEE